MPAGGQRYRAVRTTLGAARARPTRRKDPRRRHPPVRRGRLLFLGLATLAPPAAQAETGPAVQILRSVGRVDGPDPARSGAPHWDQLHLDVVVQNTLPVAAHQLRFGLELLIQPTADAPPRPIPGWRFSVTPPQSFAPGERRELSLRRALPPRRTSIPAETISYRVHIDGYRIQPPDVTTALALIKSPYPEDQRAALESFDGLAKQDGDPATRQALAELHEILAQNPARPRPGDALRVLFAVRALARAGDRSAIPRLLIMPDSTATQPWNQAVIQFARRLWPEKAALTPPPQPRIEILPAWARHRSPVLQIRSRDAIEDAAHSAVQSLGLEAIPVLVRLAASSPRTRARRAQNLLSAMGRDTIASQLSVRSGQVQAETMRALAAVGRDEATPELIARLDHANPTIQSAAHAAIFQLGAKSLPFLLDALGGPRDALVYPIARTLADRHPAAVRRAAALFGIHHGSTTARIASVREVRIQARRAQFRAELADTLNALRLGSIPSALARVQRLAKKTPWAFKEHQHEIGAHLEQAARRLYLSGDYQLALDTLQQALRIARTPSRRNLRDEIHGRLAAGYLALEAPERAEDHLKALSDTSSVGIQIRGRLYLSLSDLAQDQGDIGVARAWLGTAARLRPPPDGLAARERRLWLRDHALSLLVGALLIPFLLLPVVIHYRRRRQEALLHR